MIPAGLLIQYADGFGYAVPLTTDTMHGEQVLQDRWRRRSANTKDFIVYKMGRRGDDKIQSADNAVRWPQALWRQFYLMHTTPGMSNLRIDYKDVPVLQRF